MTSPTVLDPQREAKGDLLPGDLAMAEVTLFVADLEGMTSYYRDALGLHELRRSADLAVLGHGLPLVVLRAAPDLPVPSRREAGLFHTALLFETRAGLAATVLRAAQHPESRFAGSADHLVSEAFYFTDPEDNGIELYWDRPREQWKWMNGNIAMDSIPLDPGDYLQTHLTSSPAQIRAGVGHVHLQVGDIDLARSFYVDTLGFESTAGYLPGALFVAAGAYHHHMAMNVWNSVGAGPRAATLGLARVAIHLPRRSDLDAVKSRLVEHKIAVADDGAALMFDDPWNNPIRLSSSEA